MAKVPEQIINAIIDELHVKWHVEVTITECCYNREWDIISRDGEEICDIYQDITDTGLVLILQYAVEDDDEKGMTKQLQWAYEYGDPNSFDLNKIVNRLYTIIRLHTDLQEDLLDADE